MSTYNYESYSSKSSDGAKDYKVGYFSLKNDGDEAIVKFPYSSPSEFNMATVHKIQVNNKFRTISCLRNGHEPIENCPLCAKGEKLLAKFYVKLVEYTKDEDGKVVAKAKIWERPAGFTAVIKGLIDEYGDLKEQVFKIKRSGTGLDTRYNVFFANPAIYKKELGYTADALKDFEGLELNHHSYMERTKDEIETFLATGDFPKFNPNSAYAKPAEKPLDTMQGAKDIHPEEYNQPKTVADLGLNESVQQKPNPAVSVTSNPTSSPLPEAEAVTEAPASAPNPVDGVRVEPSAKIEDPTVARPRRIYTY